MLMPFLELEGVLAEFAGAHPGLTFGTFERVAFAPDLTRRLRGC